MFKNKIAVVTGGTAGIGRSMVHALVEGGYFVHFVGRNRERGAAIAAELNRESERSRFIAADLSGLHTTAALADQLGAELPHVDVLANVAGVMVPSLRRTEEGLETAMAVGHFSAFVLTTRLRPALERAAHARVVNVSGVPRKILRPRPGLTATPDERPYDGVRAAFDTVHAKTVVTQRLAERWKDLAIDVNAFHPGLVRGELMRDQPWYVRLLLGVVNPLLAARSISGEHACMSPSETGTTGQMFVKTRPRPLTFDPAYVEEVWRWTTSTVERVLGESAAPSVRPGDERRATV